MFARVLRVAMIIGACGACPGCALLFGSPGAAQTRPLTRAAENPLRAHNGPLEANLRANVNFASDQCDRWPLEDRFSVQVTEKRVCVTHSVTSSSNESSLFQATPAAPQSANLTSDKGVRSVPLAASGQRTKVARCSRIVRTTDPPEPHDIWSSSYSGCVANDGFVTTDSTRLQVDNVTWTFSTP